MDIEELEEKLSNVKDPKVKLNIENTFRSKEIIVRRVKSLERTDFGTDEVLLGVALAINEKLKDVESDKRGKLKTLIEKIVNM